MSFIPVPFFSYIAVSIAQLASSVKGLFFLPVSDRRIRRDPQIVFENLGIGDGAFSVPPPDAVHSFFEAFALFVPGAVLRLSLIHI